MNRHAEMLAIKRRQIAHLKATILPSANTRTGFQRAWQSTTPAGVVYPAAQFGPVSIAGYRVPPGVSGLLQTLIIVHNGAGFVDQSGVLLWHLLKNGYPVPGWENLTSQIGSIAPYWQPQKEIDLVLQQNDLIEVLVEVPTAVAAPAGTPFAAMTGFISYGGLQTFRKD